MKFQSIALKIQHIKLLTVCWRRENLFFFGGLRKSQQFSKMITLIKGT